MNYFKYFKENGYCVVKNLFNITQISKAQNAIIDCFSNFNKQSYGGWDNINECLSNVYDEDSNIYFKILASLHRNLNLFQTSHSDDLTSFLKTEFGFNNIFLPGGHVLHVMANHLRKEGGYFGLGAHQDFPSVQGSINGVIAWIPLTNVTSQHFPVQLIPKSHKAGLYETENESGHTPVINSLSVNEQDFIDIEVGIGDVILMSVFTVHRSKVIGKNSNLRIALSTRFDDGSEESFINRCYPTAYQRTVHRDLFVQDFPALSDIKKIFG